MDKGLANLIKKFGSGELIDLDSKTSIEMDRFSTGSLLLDMHSGGGWPKGRIIEIYGPESSGKSTMCIHAAVEMQKTGGIAAYIDMEHALDPTYAENLGLSLGQSHLLFAQPDSAEDALDMAQSFAQSGEVGLIILDSVAALTPRAELEGASGDAIVGLTARLMSQALRKLNGALLKTQTTMIFVNQLRSKIGVIYGSPETTTGGNALKFYASIRVDMRRVAINKNKEGEALSNNVKCKFVKNKTFPPFREPVTRIVYGKGFDKIFEVIQTAISAGIISLNRGNYTMGDTKLAYGEPKMIDLVTSDDDFRNDLIELIKKNI